MEFAKRMSRFGVEIFSKLAEIKKKKTAKGEEVIDFNIGAPNIPPASHIMEALCKAVAEPSNYVYAINDRKELLETVRGWYSVRHGVELGSETETRSLLGSWEGLVHIVLSITGGGGVVLIPDPCYPVLGDKPQIVGVRLHYVPQRKENGYIICLDETPEDAVREAKLMVVSYPNNPTTAMTPDSFCEKLIDFIGKYDITVLRDNAYSDLVFDERERGSFLRSPGVKEIGAKSNSLPKAYELAGVRIGFRLDNSQVVLHLKLLKSNMDCGVFLPVQAAVAAAVTEGQSCMQTARQTYEARRNIMCDGSTSIGWRMEQPEAVMFVWAVTSEHYTTSEMFVMELVERAGVMVTSSNAFGPSGEGYVRLALVQDEKVLNKAIRAVRESGVLLKEGKR